MSQVVLVSGDTRCCPNESYTVGSMSIEIGGTSVRMACAEARHALVEQAARLLQADPSRITADGGLILLDGKPSGLDYWQVAARGGLEAPGNRRDRLHSASERTSVAAWRGSIFHRSSPAADSSTTWRLPGMLHGRVLRPPSYGARLQSLDRSRAQALPGVVNIWCSGDFVGVCCEREYQAVKALEALRAGAHWIESETAQDARSWKELLPSLRSIDSEAEVGARPASAAGARRVVRYLLEAAACPRLDGAVVRDRSLRPRSAR